MAEENAEEAMRAKRAAIDEKMAARELERQEARAVAKENATSTLQLPEYEASFAAAQREALAALGELEALAAADTAALDACARAVERLHKLVAAAASFLPSATLASSNAKTAELETLLRTQRERLAPKKKFSFKNRGKVGAAVGVPAVSVAEPVRASAAAHADSFAASAATCRGLRSHADAALMRPAGEESNADFALSDLTRCMVQLRSSSTALWIRKLEGCTVLAVPVAGAIYISECKDCVFLLASRQARIHTSSNCDFYLHTASHPIIEHCSAFRFAPYAPRLPLPPALATAFKSAALDPERNNWSQVDDFDWLKAQQSPNWVVLSETERDGGIAQRLEVALQSEQIDGKK